MTSISSTPLTASAQLFRALGDENRLRIIAMLGAGERCVCDLQSELELGQSLLSFHLRVLREAGLVTDRRAGRWAYYSLRPEAISALTQHLGSLHEQVVALPVISNCCD